MGGRDVQTGLANPPLITILMPAVAVRDVAWPTLMYTGFLLAFC